MGISGAAITYLRADPHQRKEIFVRPKAEPFLEWRKNDLEKPPVKVLTE
jgi:hypothetical protein